MLKYEPEFFFALHWGRKWGPMTFETDDFCSTCIGPIYDLPNLEDVPLGWYYSQSNLCSNEYICSDSWFCIRFITSKWSWLGPICRKI